MVEHWNASRFQKLRPSRRSLATESESLRKGAGWNSMAAGPKRNMLEAFTRKIHPEIKRSQATKLRIFRQQSSVDGFDDFLLWASCGSISGDVGSRSRASKRPCRQCSMPYDLFDSGLSCHQIQIRKSEPWPPWPHDVQRRREPQWKLLFGGKDGYMMVHVFQHIFEYVGFLSLVGVPPKSIQIIHFR